MYAGLRKYPHQFQVYIFVHEDLFNHYITKHLHVLKSIPEVYLCEEFQIQDLLNG